jgi:hypothetical protein
MDTLKYGTVLLVYTLCISCLFVYVIAGPKPTIESGKLV